MCVYKREEEEIEAGVGERRGGRGEVKVEGDEKGEEKCRLEGGKK